MSYSLGRKRILPNSLVLGFQRSVFAVKVQVYNTRNSCGFFNRSLVQIKWMRKKDVLEKMLSFLCQLLSNNKKELDIY